jgi:hypothetical protein
MAINRDKPTTRQPTFSVEEANKLLAEVAASRQLLLEQKQELDALKAKVADAPAKVSMAGKTTKQVQNEIACIRAFKKLGIKATPRVDTFTYNIWVSKGYRAKEGTKAVKVANLRLFHASQVRPLTAAEKKASAEQVKAAESRKPKATVTELHPAS